MFIQSRDKNDFENMPNFQFLNNDFKVNEEHFQTIPSNSIVILDDFFLLPSKQNKIDFLNVVNYYLRHHQISLFLIIHNIYNNGLLNEILLAPHLILAYSNLGYYIVR